MAGVTAAGAGPVTGLGHLGRNDAADLGQFAREAAGDRERVIKPGAVQDRARAAVSHAQHREHGSFA